MGHRLNPGILDAFRRRRSTPPIAIAPKPDLEGLVTAALGLAGVGVKAPSPNRRRGRWANRDLSKHGRAYDDFLRPPPVQW